MRQFIGSSSIRQGSRKQYVGMPAEGMADMRVVQSAIRISDAVTACIDCGSR